MKYEHFGICRLKNSAFSAPTRKAALPDDYVGDFAEPTNPQDCCVVLRRTEGTRGAKTPPRRCGGRRQRWNPKRPEAASMCCHAHRAHEQAAKAWRASQGAEQ
jgi:hypothetical protein